MFDPDRGFFQETVAVAPQRTKNILSTKAAVFVQKLLTFFSNLGKLTSQKAHCITDQRQEVSTCVMTSLRRTHSSQPALIQCTGS